MDKPAPKKHIFSTKDLPSSSDKFSDVPLKLKKKLKAKSQRLKKSIPKKTEPVQSLPDPQISKIPPKNDGPPDPLDPSMAKILGFFQIKESFEFHLYFLFKNLKICHF
jgi:hypothetical protein